ncbi:MAG: hypothetical protein HC769_05940 [Cyanobacteria bacterium CRU_2_1]|nr:hypothetical protein [Cyanobacteria bacterium CRU_2_1]
MMNQLARRDLFVCLGIWLALETICFALLPALKFDQSGGKSELWFIISLPLGIGGAFLMASSTQLALVSQTEPRLPRSKKLGLSLLAFLSSWAGLLGIGFPLLFMSIQIFNQLFAVINA